MEEFSKLKQSKVKPPFPNLEIYNVTALILAMFGFEDEVKELLWELSSKTRKYFAGHRTILSSFLIMWKSEIKDLASFGHEKAPWDCLYPKKD